MNQGKLTKKTATAKNFENKNSIKKTSKDIMEDTSVTLNSQFLSNTKITIVGGGGIAAIELPKLARELRRQGAEIQFCVTENCLKFIGLESLRWASRSEVIINPTGLAEHICTSDAIVVTPATADIISKASNGICSDGATTLLQSALGQKKTIIFCPTMHESLSNSPIVDENKEKLKNIEGVYFTTPRQEEGKDKLPSPDILSINIAHIINKRKLFLDNPKKVLITLGGTRALLDPVRCITNLSTGSLGIEVAKIFYSMGINLTLLAANTSREIPKYENAQLINLPNYTDMYDYLKEINENKYNGIIHLVAGSDFIPKSLSHSKISSKNENLRVDLVKAEKIIDLENLAKISFKAAAKLTSGEKEEGLKISNEMIRKKHLNALLWSSSNTAWNKKTEHSGVFVQNLDGISKEINVNGKKEMALQFYLSFIEYLKHKKK
ncbi:phosphopantothenoylcysteine decarboxylase [Fluviispira multicolorata]|uniref:Uncharacterized protein n=1 Tax=Fluviispira multicolorata TaxID=2654512 RepID=A0A833JD13_9BACT|nr:phosphopantothenoylcysteine decarboxylase [Fluviispira multicolorata]KAB8027782.1 hypothetical protein GCL57_14340 [Fluviispira multicolorata]